MSEISWKAVYSDGSELSQYNPDGTSNKYTDIDRSKLIKFILYKKDSLEFKLEYKKQPLSFNVNTPSVPVIVLNLDKNKRLVYRRRVAKQLSGGEMEVVYLVGYQEKLNGKNIQTILFLFEDGHIEVLDRFKEDHAWYGKVNFLPEERIDGDDK